MSAQKPSLSHDVLVCFYYIKHHKGLSASPHHVVEYLLVDMCDLQHNIVSGSDPLSVCLRADDMLGHDTSIRWSKGGELAPLRLRARQH